MRRSLLTILLAFVFVAPTFIAAATDPCAGLTPGNNFAPLACYKGTTLDNVYNTAPTDDGALAKYLNTIFMIALSVVAIAAVIRLVWAGYLYMGTDMWSKKNEAREVIRDTMFGLLLILCTYLIFFQINPCMLNFNILRSFTPGEGCSI